MIRMTQLSRALIVSVVCVLSPMSAMTEAEQLDEPLKPLPAAPLQDPQRVALGKQLFNDPRLSANNTVSCASCHNLSKNGADDKQFSVGFDGQAVGVNTPTVFNASLNFIQFWNGRVDTLEDQVKEVVVSHVEMGNTWENVVATLSSDATYSANFRKAYADGVTTENVQNALASYEKTLLTPNSRFDQYLGGNTNVLTPEEKSGYQRFKSYGCIACHQGVNIGGNMFQKFGVMGDYFKARGNPTDSDLGRYLTTGAEEDRNVFRVPGLRNVELTAPYFHDGSAKTLEEAVDVMFTYQLGRMATLEDKRLIILFLKTLTGEFSEQPL
jgi:cytochrome c peroxidase